MCIYMDAYGCWLCKNMYICDEWHMRECLFRQLLLQCLMVPVINIASRQRHVIIFLCVSIIVEAYCYLTLD